MPWTKTLAVPRMSVLLACCAYLGVCVTINVPTASAAFTLTTTKCIEGAGVDTFCDATVEKGTELFELSGEEEVLFVAETNWFMSVFSLSFRIRWLGVKGVTLLAIQTSPLVKGGFILGKLLLESVTVAEPVTCKLPGSTIETFPLKGVLNTKGTEVTLENETTAGATGNFASITVEGAECPATLVGTNTLKGTQTCTVPEGDVDKKVHLIICSETGSALKLAGSLAVMSGTAEGELESGIPWSVQEA